MRLLSCSAARRTAATHRGFTLVFAFRYPTVTMLVGDNDALKRFDAAYRKSFAVETVSDWAVAERRLHSEAHDLLGYGCDVRPAEADDRGPNWREGDRMVVVAPPRLGTLLAGSNRSRRVSCVLIAGSPGDKHVQAFCQSIADLPVGRIMLISHTEVAAALDSLNDRVIDGALVIGEPGLAMKLERQIARARDEYFERLCAPLSTALGHGATAFMTDPATGQLLSSICRDMGAQEYYVCSEPPGVYLITARREAAFLLICDEDYRRAQREISALREVPTDRGGGGAHFPPGLGFSESGAAGAWRDHVLQSEALEGAANLSYKLVRENFATRALFEKVRASAL